MNIWRLAVLSLSRRPLQTMIAFISISLSVATSGLLLRTYQLSESRFKTMGEGGDVIVGAKAGKIEILLSALNSEGPFPEFIPFKLFETIRDQETLTFSGGEEVRTNRVREATPLLFFGHLETGERALGTDVMLFRMIQAGFSEGHSSAGEHEIAIGSEISRRYNWHLGDRVKVFPWFFENVSKGRPKDYTVVGVLAPTNTTWDKLLFASIPQAQASLSVENLEGHSVWKDQIIHYFLMSVNPADLPPLQDLINRRSVGQMVVIEDAKKELANLTSAHRQLGIWLTFFVLALGGLSMAALSATRFEALRGQVAILGAIGYRRAQIITWLLSEAFLLTGSALVFGALLDFLAFPTIRRIFLQMAPGSDFLEIPLRQSSPVWIAAIIATLAATLIPVFSMARQDLHAALKDGT